MNPFVAQAAATVASKLFPDRRTLVLKVAAIGGCRLTTTPAHGPETLRAIHSYHVDFVCIISFVVSTPRATLAPSPDVRSAVGAAKAKTVDTNVPIILASAAQLCVEKCGETFSVHILIKLSKMTVGRDSGMIQQVDAFYYTNRARCGF